MNAILVDTCRSIDSEDGSAWCLNVNSPTNKNMANAAAAAPGKIKRRLCQTLIRKERSEARAFSLLPKRAGGSKVFADLTGRPLFLQNGDPFVHHCRILPWKAEGLHFGHLH
ncbi:hypothetical protein VQ056_14440 [Paenibacillus sp. JTLBN-2024]